MSFLKTLCLETVVNCFSFMGPPKNKDFEDKETEEEEETKTNMFEPDEKKSLRDWDENKKEVSLYDKPTGYEMKNLLTQPPKDVKPLIGNIDEDNIKAIKSQPKQETEEPDFFDQANLKTINNIQFSNVIKVDNSQKKSKEPAVNVLNKFNLEPKEDDDSNHNWFEDKDIEL